MTLSLCVTLSLSMSITIYMSLSLFIWPSLLLFVSLSLSISLSISFSIFLYISFVVSLIVPLSLVRHTSPSLSLSLNRSLTLTLSESGSSQTVPSRLRHEAISSWTKCAVHLGAEKGHPFLESMVNPSCHGRNNIALTLGHMFSKARRQVSRRFRKALQ